MKDEYERKPRSERAQSAPSEGRLSRAEKLALQAESSGVTTPALPQTPVQDIVLRGRPSRLEKRLEVAVQPNPVWKTKPPKTSVTTVESVITDLYSAKISNFGITDSEVCLDDGRRFQVATKKIKEQGISQIVGHGLFVQIGKSWAGDNEVVVAVLTWDKGVSVMQSAKA